MTAQAWRSHILYVKVKAWFGRDFKRVSSLFDLRCGWEIQPKINQTNTAVLSPFEALKLIRRKVPVTRHSPYCLLCLFKRRSSICLCSFSGYNRICVVVGCGSPRVRIPVATYQRHVNDTSGNLPCRVNKGWYMPVMFIVSSNAERE